MSEDPRRQPGQDLVVHSTAGRRNTQLSLKDQLLRPPTRRRPETGLLGEVQDRLGERIILPASAQERLAIDREITRIGRQRFRRQKKRPLQIGVVSGKGGIAKSSTATRLAIRLKQNDDGDNVLVVDVNPADSTLLRRNDITLEAVEAKDWWTHQKLTQAIMDAAKDPDSTFDPSNFNDIDARMPRRRDPSFGVLPLDFELEESARFSGNQFLIEHAALVQSYSAIVYDFGPELNNSLALAALGKLDGIFLLTGQGKATAEQTSQRTSRLLRKYYPKLMENVVVVMSYINPPQRKRFRRVGFSPQDVVLMLEEELGRDPTSGFDPEQHEMDYGAVRVSHFQQELVGEEPIYPKGLNRVSTADDWGLLAQMFQNLVGPISLDDPE